MASAVVGVNSFISVAEADEIMSDNYMSMSDEMAWWNGLSESDKAVVLIAATNKLNNEQLMWIGQRVDDNQSLSFPRLDVRNGIEYDIDSTFKLGILKLVINDNSAYFNDMSKLVKSGITSFSDGGGMSVKFSDDIVSKNSLKNSNIGIPNDIFRTYFIKYSYLSM